MIKIDVQRDELFSQQGKDLIGKYYEQGKEGVQKALARAANCYSYGDDELAQFIYDAASRHWFFYSSPILSNAVEGDWNTKGLHKYSNFWHELNKPMRKNAWIGPEPKAMPIACFLSLIPDTINGQIESSKELALLSVLGGGTAGHSKIRAVSDKAPGPIPYFKTIDGIMGYYQQGRTRRGSTALYLDVSHPDILEFIRIRTTSGGDPARKINNRVGVHNAINISSKFIDAVDANAEWELICPHTNAVLERVNARTLWETILETRELTGEPYLWFKDVANEALPLAQKKLGLVNNGSNLCSEISLATNELRTAVCCLSSLNLEKYDEWKDTPLVANLVRFLDNVLQWFIDYAPVGLEKAIFAASQERAIGIGAMGWHNFLMSKNIPFESGGFNSAAQWNHIIFKDIYEKGIAESISLSYERGEAPDMVGYSRRNSHVFAIAPNSNSSVLCNTSPSVEPIASNAYTQKSRAGIYLVKNKFLSKVLQEYDLDTETVWKSIIDNNGSVQHLDVLSPKHRLVYRTAWEIDQNYLVEHAEQRQEYICQAQSINLFFLPGTPRSYINQVHLKAARGRKIKSLYYFRTGSAQNVDVVQKIERKSIVDCISCEG